MNLSDLPGLRAEELEIAERAERIMCGQCVIDLRTLLETISRQRVALEKAREALEAMTLAVVMALDQHELAVDQYSHAALLRKALG